MKYKILLLTLIAALVIPGASCKDNQKKPKVVPTTVLNQECGECLNLSTGKVCTRSGVMKNSCYAICNNVEILCYASCPCPQAKKNDTRASLTAYDF